MSYRSDPTASSAMGNITREWNQMVALAIRIRESGDPEIYITESRRFRGIFRRLLDEPLDNLRKMARGKERRQMIWN